MEVGLANQIPSGAAAIGALGSHTDELGQVLALLRATGVVEPARMRVGAGDRRLLELHRELTGHDVEVAVSCGECKTVSAAVLSPHTVPPETPRADWHELRPPTYADLLDLPADADQAEAELLRRCTVDEAAFPGLAEELDRMDDSLTGPVVLACAECGATLEVAADVEQLVLQGLQRYAAEVELEIHLLARAYGWSLPAIEALPDERRRRLARLVTDGR